MHLIIGFNRNLVWYFFIIALLHFLLPFILLGSETNQNKTMGILDKGRKKHPKGIKHPKRLLHRHLRKTLFHDFLRES